MDIYIEISPDSLKAKAYQFQILKLSSCTLLSTKMLGTCRLYLILYGEWPSISLHFYCYAFNQSIDNQSALK